MSNPNHPLAVALWELSNELDRAALELDFIGHAIDTAQYDTSDGACSLLAHLRDKIETMSRQAMGALKANPEEGNP